MINLWKNYNAAARNNHVNNIFKKIMEINKFSTQVAVKEHEDKELARTIDKITGIKVREIKKKPQKPPFAKNLFIGIYDNDILTYPELSDKNTVDNLEKDLVPVKDFFENIDDKKKTHITQYYLSNLSNLKLIGLQIPSFEGGRQLSISESCRYLEEMSRNTSRIGIIDSEQLGIQILQKYANDEQRKYLHQLIDGKTVISCCITEAELSSPDVLQTKATLSPDKKTWILNGTKKWITNADTGDLFIVFAETEKLNEKGLTENGISAFIVDKQFGGVRCTPCKTTGLDQTDISNIVFENTSIPGENVIDEIGAGNKIISSVLTQYRLSKGPTCTALLRNGINEFLKYLIEMNNDTTNILETDAVQAKLGELTTSLYAIESVTYLTAGLLDQYENQDCELESAIVKFLSTNYCYNSLRSIMGFLGIATYMQDNWCNRLHRDSLGHVLLNESVDSSKLMISLIGLQHAGVILLDKIRMMRNPLFHPAAAFKRMWTQKRHIEDNPKLALRLHEYLHPSITNGAQMLEYSVLRLQFATETLLSRYGPEVINKHIDLARLAECVIDIYAMTAILGRASRSYCTGLRHADLEMQIAMGFAYRAKERVKSNVNKIWNGPYITGDEIYLTVGKYAINQKEYFPVHPLTRNY